MKLAHSQDSDPLLTYSSSPADGECQPRRREPSIPPYSSSPADGEEDGSPSETPAYSWSPAEGECIVQYPHTRSLSRLELHNNPTPISSWQPRDDSGYFEPSDHVFRGDHHENNTRMGGGVGIRELLKAPKDDSGEDSLLPELPPQVMPKTRKKSDTLKRSKIQKQILKKKRFTSNKGLHASAVGTSEEGEFEGYESDEDVPVYSDMGSGLPWNERGS